MNRSQPAAVIAAQQKLLEAASRQTNLQSHDVQQKLQALGRQVAAAQAQRIKDNAQSQKSAKQSVLANARAQASPYARPQVYSRPALIQKYDDLVSVIEELGKDVRPTYAGSKSATERLKRGLQHARQLVRECQAEGEKVIRNQV